MATVVETSKLAAIAGQTLMRDGFKKDVLATGHWGAYTQKVFASLTKIQQDQVIKVISAYNADLSAIVAIAKQASVTTKASLPAGQSLSPAESMLIASKSGLPPGYIWEADLFKIFARVSASSGVSVSVLKRFLSLECPRRIINGKACYNSAIRNSGGYSGLFQFDRKGDAWKSASYFVELLPFASSWMDPYQNSLAAAGYILSNTKTIRGLGYKGIITGSIAYLMHNQGATGAFKVMRGMSLQNKQSGDAIKVAAVAQREFASQVEIA